MFKSPRIISHPILSYYFSLLAIRNYMKLNKFTSNHQLMFYYLRNVRIPVRTNAALNLSGFKLILMTLFINTAMTFGVNDGTGALSKNPSNLRCASVQNMSFNHKNELLIIFTSEHSKVIKWHVEQVTIRFQVNNFNKSFCVKTTPIRVHVIKRPVDYQKQRIVSI